MSKPEESSVDRSNERTEEIVRSVGEKAASDAFRLWNGVMYHRLFPDTVDQLVEKQREFVESEVRRLREQGYLNDNYSVAPGLTAYLTASGEEAMHRICEEAGYPYADSLEEVDEMPGTFKTT